MSPAWNLAVRIYIRLCVIAGLAALAGFALLETPSRVLPAQDPSAEPPYPGETANPDSPVWIVRSAPGAGGRDPKRTFSALDAGAFWANLAMHEFGSAWVVTPDVAAHPIPDSVRVLVVTRGARQRVVPYLGRLRRFVAEGGCLFVECPDRPWAGLLGLKAQEADPVPIDRVRTDGADPLVAFLELDAQPVVLVSGMTATVWGQVAGVGRKVPLVWRRTLGRGVVVGMAWDVGKTWLSRVQGTPGEDFTFRPPPREGALAGVPVPADMVGDYPAFTEPVLDRLERALWWTGLEVVAVPAWWACPQGKGAVYLCTHDEEGFGDRSLFMVEEEARLGEVATYFVLPEPLTAGAIRRMKRHGAEVALHWQRTFGGPALQTYGVGPFVLLRKALGLEAQRQILARKGAAPLPAITRVHGLAWDPDFDTTFRKLVAAGFRLDSSYGPHGDLGPFVFGTLQPFRPMDRGGHLMPILELPFSLQDDEGAPRERLRRLFSVGSAHHLPIVPIFHTNTMSYKPSVGPIEAWLEGFQLARRRSVWVGTVGAYLRFLEARSSARMVGSRRGATRESHVEVPGERLWVRLPCRSGEGRLERIEVDGKAVVGQAQRWGGHRVLVAPVPRGRHRLRVSYGLGQSVCRIPAEGPREEACH